MNVRYACGDCGTVYEEESLAVKCCNDIAQEVSGCCGGYIDHKERREHPLDDRYSIRYLEPVCEECGEELA